MNISLLSLLMASLMLLLFATGGPASESTDENNPENASQMLQHNVYFYLNEDVTSEERKQFEKGLKELLEIDEIHKAELGVPADTQERDVTDHAFAYAIFTWFKTMENYKIYAEHPDHLEFIDKYDHLWADVKVFDSKIIE